MAATGGISTEISVLGDSEYKKSMQDIGRQLTVLNTGLKATESAFGGQGGSVEALTEKQKSLQELYDAQAKKVKLVSEQLNKAKGEYSENSKEVDELQIALNRAQTAMNKVGTELGTTTTALEKAETAQDDTAKTSDDLADAAKDAAKQVDAEGDAAKDAEGENSKLHDALSKVGSVAGGALKIGLVAAASAFTAVSAAAGAAIVKAYGFAGDAGAYADDLLTLSTQTSVSAETLQGWSYAARFIDTDVDVMTKSMSKMIKVMGESEKGSKTATAKFTALGVSIKDDVTGKLRGSEDIFMDCIDALGKIGNESERDALAMDLFGKSAQELNPLIEAGGQALSDMNAEAATMGTVFSDAALDTMGSFDDSMQRLEASGDGLKTAIGLIAIPAFQPLVDAASKSMGKVSLALQNGLAPSEVTKLIKELAADAAGAFGEIGTMLEDAAPVVEELLGTLVDLAVESLPGMATALMPAALGLITNLLGGIGRSAQPIGQMLSTMLSSAIGFAGDASLHGAISETVTSLVTAGIGVIVTLLSNAPEILAAGGEIALALFTGLVNALPAVFAGIGQVFSSLFTNADEVTAAYEEQFSASLSAFEAFQTGLDKANEGLASSQADAEAKKTLATELLALYSELEEKDVKTNTDLTLMAGYATQIAELYPGLADYIDPVTGLFTENTAAITANVEARHQLKLLEAYDDHLDALYAVLKDANIAQSTFNKELQAAAAEAERLSEQSASVQGLYSHVFEDNVGVTSFLDNLTAVYNAIKENSDIENPLFGLVDVLEDGTVKLRDGVDATDALKDAKLALNGVNEETLAAFNLQNEALDDARASQATYQAAVDDTTTEITELYSTIDAQKASFNALPAAATAAGAAITQLGEDTQAAGEDAQAGVDGISNAAADLEDIGETASDAKDGVEGAATEIATTKDAILATVADIKGAQTAADAAQKAIKLAADTISTDAAAALTDMETTGATITLYAEAMLEAISTAITDGTVTVALSGATMAAAVVTAVAVTMSAVQGSTLGTLFGLGTSAGVSATASIVASAASGLGSSAYSALSGYVGYNGSTFRPLGYNVAQGFANGIRDGIALVRSAASAAGHAAYNATKGALQINSPSRVMAEIGGHFDDGFAQGITGNMDKVLASVRMMSAMAASEMQVSNPVGGGVAAVAQQETIDYERLGEAVATSFIRHGLGETVLQVNGRTLAQAIEPDVSQATYQRTGQSVTGRSARLLLGR